MQTITPAPNRSRNQTDRKGGRPLNSMSKLAKDAREKAQQTGMLPHEILLEMARGRPIQTLVPIAGAEGLDADGNQLFATKFVVPDFEQMKDAAKAASPYFAPKISTVEMISGVSDDDLDAIITGSASEAGVSISFDGEGAPDEAPQGAPGGNRPRVRI